MIIPNRWKNIKYSKPPTGKIWMDWRVQMLDGNWLKVQALYSYTLVHRGDSVECRGAENGQQVESVGCNFQSEHLSFWGSWIQTTRRDPETSNVKPHTPWQGLEGVPGFFSENAYGLWDHNSLAALALCCRALHGTEGWLGITSPTLAYNSHLFP